MIELDIESLMYHMLHTHIIAFVEVQWSTIDSPEEICTLIVATAGATKMETSRRRGHENLQSSFG